MPDTNNVRLRILNILILAALAVACVGSLMFAIFHEFLDRFPTSGF